MLWCTGTDSACAMSNHVKTGVQVAGTDALALVYSTVSVYWNADEAQLNSSFYDLMVKSISLGLGMGKKAFLVCLLKDSSGSNLERRDRICVP